MELKQFLKSLDDWFTAIVAWVSGIVLIGGMILVVYGVWVETHPTKPDAQYYNKGPQDPEGTH